MLIGELAQQASLSRDTIRFYEEIGLIQSVRRRANKYKEYPPEVLEDLRFIQQAKGLGFTLQEIQALIGIFRNAGTPCAQLADVLEEKLAALRAKRRELETLEQRVSEQVQRLRASAAVIQP